MWSSCNGALALALHLTAAAGYNYGAVNRDADPYVIAMVNNASIGPDGPWWYISQAIDFPPTCTDAAVDLPNLTCREPKCLSNQQASCPLPLPTMWTTSGAYQVTDGPITQSNMFDASTWDSDYAALLKMEGYGRYYRDRMTLHRNSYDEDPVFMDSQAMGISANYTVNYSSNSDYTINAGFFSLNGASEPVDWTATNGSQSTGNRTLYQTYQLGASPSIAYGLHIGSVEPNVTGSLVLGGYDSSRCLTEPVVSSYDSVQLHGIALNVSSGGHAYFNTTTAYIPNLLKANGSVTNSIPVHPRPGVPHLYLPQDTCDAIAAHLPVTYNPDFNLYFWDTKKPAYENIVSSPHYLSFTFASDNGEESTISVPFALLNLTLTSPIVSTATQYFPCKPWTPDQTGYTLGSAFLQSAFLAQNWEENKLFLAQAPGPDFLSPSIQKIAYADTTLTPARNPPSWEDSWASTLKALPDNSGSSTKPGTSKSKDDSGISGGAIAGIVIGALAGIAAIAALVWFLMRRRRRTQNTPEKTALHTPETPLPQYHQQHPQEEHGVPFLGKPALAPYEAEAQQAQVAEMWTGRDVAELPAPHKTRD